MDKISVTKSNGAWIAQHYFLTNDGSSMRKTKRFGHRTGITTARQAKSAARKWIEETQRLIDKDQLCTLTLKEFVSKIWKKHNSAVTSSTIERYTATLDGQLLPVLGHKLLSQLTFRMLTEYFQKQATTNNPRTHKKLSASGLKNYKKALSNVLNLAQRMGYIEQNNVKNINLDSFTKATTSQEVLIKRRSKRNSFTKEELQTLINYLKQDSSVPKWFENFVIIMVGTGLRDQEILALDIKYSINLEKNYLLINKAITSTKAKRKQLKGTKTGNNRRVYFNETVRSAIINQTAIIKQNMEEWSKDYGWSSKPEDEKLLFLFAHTHGLPYSVPFIGKKWKQTIENYSDIPQYNLYSLRHTYATLTYNANPNAQAVAASLGHTVESFMRYYVHPLESEQKKLSEINYF